MATESITQFPSLAAGQVASNDLLPIVDVSDLSSPTGTTKKVTVDGLLYEAVPQSGRTVTTLLDYQAQNAVYNVVNYGADVTGLTSSTAAIQAAITASAQAGAIAPIIYFPAGTYLLTSAGTDYTLTYALNALGNSVIFQGAGSRTRLSCPSHESNLLILKLNEATGDIVVRDMELYSPPRVNTTHAGPFGMSIGQMGYLATRSGTLNSLTVERVRFTNLTVEVHGMGCKVVRIDKAISAQQGGGLTPTLVANAINIGSKYDSPYRCKLFAYTNGVAVPDSVYGSHQFYLLGAFDNVIIDTAVIDDCGLNPVKFDGELTSSTTWPSDEWGLVAVRNVKFGGVTDPASDSCISFAADTICRNAIIENCTAKPTLGGSGTQKRLVYNEWACNRFTIRDCTAKNTTMGGVTCVNNVNLSNSEKGLYVAENNNFDGYNTTADGTAGIQFSATGSTAEFHHNQLNRSASGSGPSFNNSTTGKSFASSNVSNQLPLWLSSVTNYANHTDVGNSWNPVIAPTLQSSWTNFGSTYQTAGYAKDGVIVRVRGMITGGTVTSGTLLFTLAAGFRPAATMQFPCFNNTTGSTVVLVRVNVNSDGTVTLGETLAGAGWLDLSGIGFSVGG